MYTLNVILLIYVLFWIIILHYFQELLETLQNLKDICEKKDKAIQTNRMIVKFRDDSIKRLEGKLKGVEPEEPQAVCTLYKYFGFMYMHGA